MGCRTKKETRSRREKQIFDLKLCFLLLSGGTFFAADKKGLIEKMQFFVIAKYRYEKNIIGNKELFCPRHLKNFHIYGIIKVQFDETEPFRWDAIENEPANLL